MSLNTILLGGGCFWCTEAVFNEIKGINQVIAGYAGGNAPGHPTYREICSGLTGHAEVVEITYDTSTITLQDILVIFMTTHNPTTLNRQGADIGTQYRSVIYYQSKEEHQIINSVLEQVQKYYDAPIVTEVSELPVFYKAEEYHQNYYANNKEQGYCNFVITPKLKKLREMYADKLK